MYLASGLSKGSDQSVLKTKGKANKKNTARLFSGNHRFFEGVLKQQKLVI
jgi:hypothetical protein